jgi:flagellar biosynthetic protein FliR
MTLTLDGAPLALYLLSSVRIVAWLALVPPFAGRTVPWMAKMAIALGLSFAALPATAPALPAGMLGLAAIAATEVAIGVSLGFVTYMLFASIQAAGSLIDVFGGFSAAAAFDPMTSAQSTVIGRLHQMLAVSLLFVTGGFLVVIAGVVKTFQFLPLGARPDITSWSELVQTAFGLFFTLSVQIALPIILALVVVDLGLAMMTKVAPSLNAIMVMFPLKIGVTLLLMGMSFMSLPMANERIVDYVLEALAEMAGVG